MNIFKIIPITFIIFLAGCTTQVSETRQETVTPQYSIEILDYPTSVETDQTFTITWKVNSNIETTIQHTAIHYGSESSPGVLGLEVAPGETVYTSLTPDFASGTFNIPNTFSAQITAATTTTIYFRSHAIIDGQNYWTDEFSINVVPPPVVTETPPPLPQSPTVQEFTIEADDNGFYMNGNDISSISVNSGNIVKITFQVRSSGVYFGGLDFRGCGQTTSATKPGDSVTMEFTATNTCTITSYWPASNRVKDNLQVIVS